MVSCLQGFNRNVPDGRTRFPTMRRRPVLLAEECNRCPHRGRPVLCDLSDQEFARFQRIKHNFRYDAAQVVFNEGHLCFGFYVLCKGKVKLSRTSVLGRRHIISVLEGGQAIEKQAFLTSSTHAFTCETLEPSSICIIEREPYLAIVRENGALAVKLIQLLSDEIHQRLDRLDCFSFKTARERLAEVLLDLADRFGRNDGTGTVICIPFKREEIAEMARITVETAVRLLRVFQQEHLIRVVGRIITLEDQHRLKRIARCS